jgi:hypothetical protein
MTQYKYHLDKSSKKFKCPKCNKKCFVKYIETETGHYADSQYGRCDREIKCRYFEYPNGNSIISYNYVAPPPIKPTYIDKEILQKTLTKYEINPLVNFLYSNYNSENVDNVVQKYKVGTAKWNGGSTIFWQTDNLGKVRSGKVMAYDASTGKRIKTPEGKPKINWVHKLNNNNNFSLKQCLFGLHLLSDQTKRIAIVESEKTALIMSIEFPQYTWMSTGSLQGFKYDYLTPLKEKDITAFPDKGAYNKWKETADVLNNKGFNIEVSKLLETKEYEDGWDLVDMMNYENKK